MLRPREIWVDVSWMSGVVRRLVEMVRGLKVREVKEEVTMEDVASWEISPTVPTREEPTSVEKPIWALEYMVLTVTPVMEPAVATSEEPTRVEKPI